MSEPKNKSNQPGHRVIGIDQFDGTGEIHYITEGDLSEPAEGWGNQEWSDKNIARENGDDFYENDCD
ncbi:MAG: hypothetical protein AAF652_13620 [Cyanobacteria bacterium P01_C01_bin.72]